MLSLEGNVNILSCLAWGSLVSVRVGSMEGIGVTRGGTVVGLRSRCNHDIIGTLVNEHTGTIRMYEV